MATLTISKEEEKSVKGLGFLSNKGTDNFSGRVITENGLITTEQAKKIIAAAEKYGNGYLALTTRLTIECQGIPFDQIDDFRNCLAEGGLETGGTGTKVRPVMSCKGTTCQYGLIDTFGLSKEIHDRFYTGMRNLVLPHKFKMAVGGCPNNCVKPDLNDVGIIGQYRPVVNQDECRNCKSCGVVKACAVGAAQLADEKIAINPQACLNCGMCIEKCPFQAVTGGNTGYKIVIGGRWGKQVARGNGLNRLFTDQEELLATVERIIIFYQENGLPGERFAQTIERIGFETVEAVLLGH
ncbi:MAG: 4Fe-4S binding protein [Acetobacterium sp.]|nr:4Fe-4S binding protein [Bacillota bacterium]MCG2731043.1 4Fe-4S binding protein [Acetobacterium sp.]